MPTISDFKEEILRIAKANIGEYVYGLFSIETNKKNKNVKFGMFEYKCMNLLKIINISFCDLINN